mmetsp:Transcript_12758/g.26593  ORF Transcript_12758/g.26593 Transcript_12758/m.26593 type:complete len:215 (+) Transcript_12758:51-695(+)
MGKAARKAAEEVARLNDGVRTAWILGDHKNVVDRSPRFLEFSNAPLHGTHEFQTGLSGGALVDDKGSFIHMGELRWKAALRTNQAVPRLIVDRERQMEREPVKLGLELGLRHPVFQPHGTAGIPTFLPAVRTPMPGLTGSCSGAMATPRSARGGSLSCRPFQAGAGSDGGEPAASARRGLASPRAELSPAGPFGQGPPATERTRRWEERRTLRA